LERTAIRFHRDLLAILARRGWKPTPPQTLREFTQSLLGPLCSRANGKDLHSRIEHIASLFYRVRFGDKPLDDSETQEVQSDLQHLSRGLAPN
jgi:hypothetical protein